MLYRDLITLFGRPHKTHKCKALSSAAFALLDCKGPHTRSSSLRKLFDRVWCGFVVRATVWRFSNMFEFCCAAVRLCNSLKRVWTCLWVVVLRHQFVILAPFVSSFSKCLMQLQIKILQINQTGCTILLSIFISLLYVFRATMRQSSGETAVSMRYWYLSLCMDGVRSAGWIKLQPADRTPPVQSDKYQCCIDTVISPDDGYMFARNMYSREINILSRTVHPAD